MDEPKPGQPWAYIAHKDGIWSGVTIPDKGAGKFLAGFIKKGCAITTVYSREEYNAELAKLKTRRAAQSSP
jgi:hypothetical protein